MGCRKQQDCIGIDHRLVPRRKHAGRVRHEVGTEKDCYDDAANAAPALRIVRRGRAVSVVLASLMIHALTSPFAPAGTSKAPRVGRSSQPRLFPCRSSGRHRDFPTNAAHSPANARFTFSASVFRRPTNQPAIPNRRVCAKQKEIPFMSGTTNWRTTGQVSRGFRGRIANLHQNLIR